MNMMRFRIAASLLILLGSSAAGLRADCTCVCVDGLNRPLCSDSRDSVPVCPPRMCPDDSLTTRPRDELRLPPTGTQSCSMQYVYNRYSRRYEWRQLCR
jgi:hypothetical protein